MRILRNLDEVEGVTPKIVSVGSYDGIHLGHRLLIEKLNEEADRRSLEPLILTFRPHPKFVLGKIQSYLTDEDEQLILFEESGVRNVLILPFTPEFSMMSYNSFMTDILKSKLNVVSYVLGIDHSFGHNRKGSVREITEAGIETVSIELYGNIGSTRIREMICSGDIASANRLLGGKGYLIKSPVVDPHKLLPPAKRLYDAVVNGKNTKVDINNLPEGIIRLIK